VAVLLFSAASFSASGWTRAPSIDLTQSRTLVNVQLPDGLHSIALSLQDAAMEVIAEDVVDLVYANSSAPTALCDAGKRSEDPRGMAPGEDTVMPAEGVVELTVLWTCPDWEIDWISEMLEGAGIQFKIVLDPGLEHVAPNALVALSQNDERTRPPEVLARYLLSFKQRGYRVGVLHMSDEDYTAPTYFYPWVDYVLRNHYQQELARLPHVLAIPLGYKKGFWTAGDAPAARASAAAGLDRTRRYLWNFVGQTHDKPTRKTMLAAARQLAGEGYLKLTGFWNDSAGLSTQDFRNLLLDSRFTLCPRGFVHPESFRLSEALETGSVPIIERDAYFAMLFGPDHPLPMLQPPAGCPEPATARYHKPPHPSPTECADVWPALGALVEGLSPDLPSLQATIAKWWGEHKALVKRRVGALVRHGVRWQRHLDARDLPAPPPLAAGEGVCAAWEARGNDEISAGRASPAEAVGRPGAAAPAAGGAVPQESSALGDERPGRRHPPAQATALHGGGGGETPQSTGACGHHDLECRARAASSWDANPVLEENIRDARYHLGALFAADGAGVEHAGRGPGDRGGEPGGGWVVASEEEREAVERAREARERPERQAAGSFPAGPCQSDCDCAGAMACVPTGAAGEGECVRSGRGTCDLYRDYGDGQQGYLGVGGVFGPHIYVVNMNSTDVDRARWAEAVAQLAKYNLTAERVEGYDGSAMSSHDLQQLLNSGVISAEHDSLVMDGTRSVLGCALVHLNLFERIVADGNPWTLILEDDFLLPPHFPLLFRHAWPAVPPYEQVDVLYLGAGSNNKAPTSWVNSKLFRPSQTVGTHAFAVTNHGAQKVFSALRPLIQSIDSQIHETLLSYLNIYAFATPDPPPHASALRPYPLPPSRIPEPYSLQLAEPHFFPRGSFYHGLISVDEELPSTIPKESVPGRRQGRAAVFFRQPLEGDVLDAEHAGFEIVVHNFPVWNPDESEPAGHPRGYASLSINSREAARCAKRICGVVLSGLPDGVHTAAAALHDAKGALVEVCDAAILLCALSLAGSLRVCACVCMCIALYMLPPQRACCLLDQLLWVANEGRAPAQEGAQVSFVVCASGEYRCDLGACHCEATPLAA
jgi:GR25 family glycosyltransferase involved in LPS biosynthesis